MAHREFRITQAMLRILQVMCDAPREPVCGADIGERTRMRPGTYFPILYRLENAGWVESWWEQIDPKEAGRPRRRYYRLTAEGQNQTQKILAERMAPQGRLAWGI